MYFNIIIKKTHFEDLAAAPRFYSFK